MKSVLVALAILGLASSSFAVGGKMSSPDIVVTAVQGTVEFTDASGRWTQVTPGVRLPEGARLRTTQQATADLLLQYNGSVFRLAPDSEMRVERLKRSDTGLGMVTDTRLLVDRGSLIGSQRKLHKPSVLEIVTPNGGAIIRGTEYVVNAQGAVSVLSGAVDVIYNLPGNKGSVKASVPSGSSFNPATGTVVPTTSIFLQDIIADVDAVRQNAEVYKVGGATIVVKPDAPISPVKGNNGVGNGIDPQPPGNPPINDGPGTGPGNPGNKGGAKK